MKQYSFLQESVGRNLVGASRFSSRKSVASTIMQQYPNPQMLADKLQQMSQQTYGRERQQLMNLSLKCRGLDMNSYPSFAKKISGFSGIWKIAGTTAAIAGTAAATKYLMNKADEYVALHPDASIGDTVKGVAKGIPGATPLYRTIAPKMNNAIQTTKNGVNNYFNNTYKPNATRRYIAKNPYAKYYLDKYDNNWALRHFYNGPGYGVNMIHTG